MTNKELITRYPFLIPRSVWTGLQVEGYDLDNPKYTLLDSMPDGWRKAFGEQMCEEIREALLKAQERLPAGGYQESGYTTNFDSDKMIPFLEGYYITQIKEKYGTLRWYDCGAPNEVYLVIDKYERLSGNTCINCGENATKISKGWISPYCDKCADELKLRGFSFKDITEEWL